MPRSFDNIELGMLPTLRETLEVASEDIVLIKEKLVTPQIQALVDENANRQGQMTRLSDGQRLAVESFSVLLEQDPDSVPLNQFVNLLSALHRLAVPRGIGA